MPQFDLYHAFFFPWKEGLGVYGPIFLMGFLVNLSCSLIGNFLILKRMALMGDAISHSLLPGIVIAFLMTVSRSTVVMFVGAIISTLFATFCIDFLHQKTRLKVDVVLGIIFSTFFAIGVILISFFADHIDLDAECVLFGNIEYIPLAATVKWKAWVLGPLPIVRMLFVGAGVVILIFTLYKELLISSFDPA